MNHWYAAEYDRHLEAWARESAQLERLEAAIWGDRDRLLQAIRYSSEDTSIECAVEEYAERMAEMERLNPWLLDD